MEGSTQPLAPTISIVIPTLNEAAALPATLASCLADNAPQEVIVVDGGSTDRTRDLAAAFFNDHPGLPSQFSACGAGRARQMNTGAGLARGDALLFLHADTQLSGGALDAVRLAIRRGAVWGRFDVRLSGTRAVFRLIEWLMNWRSRLSGVVTGDQALFVRRDAFRLVGGFRALALMEDIDLSVQLRVISRPVRLPMRVLTSSRRWEQHGVLRTVLQMWSLRFLYCAGVSPVRLARWYR